MIYRFSGRENSPTTLRYRVLKENGTALVQADVSSIKLFVYETETATAKSGVGGDTLVVASTVYNTLQTWDNDDVGFNFQVKVPASYLSDSGKTYRVEVLVTPATGDAFYLDHAEITTEETYSA